MKHLMKKRFVSHLLLKETPMHTSMRHKYTLLSLSMLLIAFAALAGRTLLTTHAAPTSGKAVAQVHQQAADCSRTLQQLVDAANAGDTVHVPACLYREQVTINKPLTLIADPGAEIRGSDVWSDWNQNSTTWVSSQTVPSFFTHGNCDPASNGRCLWAEQAFVDGQPLFQVASNPGLGQFAVDGGRHIILGTSPIGQLVEITTRTSWIEGAADHVTIQGFRMQHSANDAQQGALKPNNHTYWTVEDNVLSDAHGAVVDVSNNMQLLRNNIFRGGDLGIHGGNVNSVLIQGNRIHNNNTEAFDTGWEAGGIKIAASQNLTIDGNEIYDNAGPGAWCDISCKSVVYTNNRVHDNAGAGIFYEISNGAQISNNQIWENGWSYSAWGWGAGILLSNSSNAEVYNNTVAWNADGITVISINRVNNPGDDPSWNNVVGDYIHDNTIIMTGDDPSATNNEQVYVLAWLQQLQNGVLYTPASNNHSDNTALWVGDQAPAHYQWDEQDYSDLSAFAATPGGHGSHYISDADRDSALSQAQIPLTPQPRPAASHFATGFEPGDQQPTWINTVDSDPYPAGGSNNVSGVCCGLTMPEAGTRTEAAHAGSAALMYSGSDTDATSSYAYLSLFDLSTQGVTVGSGTTLSYWIFPQSSQGFGGVSGNNSTCVAIDLIFSDGSNLRDSGAVDQNGNRAHPAFQCEHLTLDQWNQVTVNLGANNSGKTIVRIDVGYDQPGNTGAYRGYIDDIQIQ